MNGSRCELADEPLVVPDFEVVVPARARPPRRSSRPLAQASRNEDAALGVELGRPGRSSSRGRGTGGGRGASRASWPAGLDPLPDRHGVDAHGFAGQAGHEDLPAMGFSTSARKPFGTLSRPLSSILAGEFPRSTAFAPLWSTQVHRDGREPSKDCQRKRWRDFELRFFFAMQSAAGRSSSTTGGTIAGQASVRRARASINLPMLRAGLIGLPATGKTTLFQLMTAVREAAARRRAAGEVQIGVSKVPDPRLDHLTALFKPKKHTPATVEFADMAAAGGGRQGAGRRRRLPQRRRAAARRARVQRSGGAALARVDRPGARRAGDGGRTDPRRPRRASSGGSSGSRRI